jgi:hypothetical protein
MISTATRGRILAALQECTVATFDDGDWTSLANRLDLGDAVSRRPRLFSARSWGDPDYGGLAADVLDDLLGEGLENLTTITERSQLEPWLREHDARLHAELFGTVGVTVDDEDLASLTDPGAITEHLTRLRAIDSAADPALAIGTAKDLIESTVKVVLNDLGEPVDNRTDLPKLIDRLHRRLDADPSSIDGTDPAAPAVRRILGGLKSVALGAVELRNQVGTGHGRIAATALSSDQLGRIAVDTACTYCGALLALHSEYTNRRR